jgi:hypothetical protein
LISIGTLTKELKGSSFKFNHSQVTWQSSEYGDVIVGSLVSDGLYVCRVVLKSTDLIDRKKPMAMLAVSSDVWHQRLGHSGDSVMSKLSPSLGFTPKRDPNCVTCLKGKATRFSFKGSTIKTTRPLELIHSDVCGPINDSDDLEGNKYFVTFIDDYTRYATVYRMEAKSDVNTILQNYIDTCERKFSGKGYKVHRIRSDNG